MPTLTKPDITYEAGKNGEANITFLFNTPCIVKMSIVTREKKKLSSQLLNLCQSQACSGD